MKRNLIAMCCVAALACAGTASADVLAEDSANNYTAETFVSGANLGSGFGEWVFWNAWPTLADSTAGVCGDINSENGFSFRFARDGGADYCNGYRGFDALKTGDTLTFRFTCAYCGGGRGLDLFANGGHEESDKIANVIHLSGDNEFSVNGTVISTEWAPNAVTEVAVVQEADGIRIAVARTTPDEKDAGNVAYWTKVPTDKKLTGIGIYAGGWDWNDGADVENYAFYVNDLKIEGEPPTDTLSLDGTWAVTAKEAELSFKVTRQNSEGTLDVALASSYPEFASVPATVTFADGETEVPFTVAATLQGNANAATISASAEGVAGATYGIKGPQYNCNSWDPGIEGDDVWQIYPDDTRTLWVNNENSQDDFPDDTLVTVESADPAVVTVGGLGEWQVGDNGKSYNSCTVTGVGGGKAAVKVLYDGVEMTSFDFTVRNDSLSLAGPLSVRAGSENVTYTLTGVFANGSAPDFAVEISDGSVDPSAIEELVTDTPVALSVNFPETAGKVTLSVHNDDLSASLDIEVTEAPDYSSYIAYDDASLYTVGLDYNAVGEGTEKFKGWKDLYKNADGETRFAGATLVSGAADASVLTDDKAFAVYANGDDGAEIQLLRPFQNSLGDGQEFSVVLSPNFRDGTKGVKFLGEWEGAWYPRAEFFYNNDGYFYKLDGDENATSLDWGFATDAITLALKKAADGSSYTLSISRGDEVVAKEGITSFQGSVDGVLFYSWNGGDGDENNLVFNSLAIQQVEEPVVVRNIWWVSGVNNPDAAGDYTFTIAASTTDIGVVALAIEPAEGTVATASLSEKSIDLAGVTEASFTVTLSEAVAGDKFTVTATPADTEVGALSYDIYPIAPWLNLKSDNDRWEFTTDDKEIWMFAEASPANYGTYELAIAGDEGVLELSVDSVTVPGEEYGRFWFNVYIKGAGEATVYLKDFGPDAENKSWRFTVNPGDERPELPAPAVVTTSDKRRGLAWKLEDLDSTYFLGAYSLLGDVAWTHLEQGKDYVIENEQLIVLFDGDFFKGQRVGFVTFGEIPPPPVPQ